MKKRNVLLIIIIGVIIYVVFDLYLFFNSNEYCGKDTAVCINDDCQIVHSNNSKDLYCNSHGTLVENVYKYRWLKNKKIIYVIGKNKNGENTYSVLKYDKFWFMSYKDINYCSEEEKQIFMDIEKFNHL